MTNVPAKPAMSTHTAGALGIVPKDLDDCWRLASAFLSADMVPASYGSKKPRGTEEWAKETTARLAIGIMKAIECGFPVITGLNNIAVINNRPSIWGDGAVALVQQSGALVGQKIEKVGNLPAPGEKLDQWPNDYGYRVSYIRQGQESAPYIATYLVKDARQSGLWNKYNNGKPSPWVTSPDRMLFNRARAFALRDGFADKLMGLSIREEMEDIERSGEAAVSIPVDAPPEPKRSDFENAREDAVDTEPSEDPFPFTDAYGEQGDVCLTAEDFEEAMIDALAEINVPGAANALWEHNEEQIGRLSEDLQASLLQRRDEVIEVLDAQEGAAA